MDHRNPQNLVALILDSYNEYVSLSYPGDPNVYVVRASPNTKKYLLSLDSSLVYQIKNIQIKDPENSFMGFRVESVPYLEDDEVIFGPETVSIKWSM